MRRSVSVQVAVGSVIVVVVGIREIVSRKGLIPKQTIHVLLRIEDDQIVDLFADACVSNR